MIRLFGLRDVVKMGQLQSQGLSFDLRRNLLYPPSPVRAAIVASLSQFHAGGLTAVHVTSADDDGAEAFAQVWSDASRTAWDLTFLAPSLEFAPQAVDAWQQLLTHLMVLGAQQGISRIRARTNEDPETEHALRRAGLTLVSREEVFACSQQLPPAPLPKGLRRATRRDRYSLEELYRKAVPLLVGQVEGFPAAARGSLARLSVVSFEDYVWAEKGRLVAHIGLWSGPRAYWLDVLVHPEYRADVLPYVRFVLTRTESRATRPVYCPVSDYGVGLGWLLRTIGFTPYARQSLLVGHTASRVPVRERVLARGLESGVKVGTPLGSACESLQPVSDGRCHSR